MSIDDLENLLGLLDDAIKGNYLNNSEKGKYIKSNAQKITGIFTKKENIEAENSVGALNSATEKFESLIQGVGNSKKNRSEILKDAGFTDADIKASEAEYDAIISELKKASETIGKIQARVVKAKNTDFDMSSYIDAKNEKINDLGRSMSNYAEQMNAYKNGREILFELDEYKDYDKINATINAYTQYNKLIDDINAAKQQTPIDRDKIDKLQEKLNEVKETILSDKSIQFDKDDYVWQPNPATGVTDQMTLKDCLNYNLKLDAFINGDIFNLNPNKTPSKKLEDQRNTAWQNLVPVIKKTKELQKIFPTISGLTAQDFQAKVEKIDEHIASLNTKYIKAKNEIKAKEASIETYEKDKKFKEDMAAGLSNSELYDRYMSDAERGQLRDFTKDFRSRNNYWNDCWRAQNPEANKFQQFLGRISSFVKSIGTKRTENAVKHWQLENNSQRIDNENQRKTSEFRKGLIEQAAKGQELDENDMQKAYQNIKDVDPQQQESSR